jgi:medium-chain acyl-[acyl-carrier-protein] hydrolase
MTASSDKWLVRFQPNRGARLRLFCFPYAGNGASAFRPFSRGLPQEVEVCAVQPPGREERWREDAFTDIPALVSAAVDALAPHLTEPFALFGHSLGAKVAFEFARRLQADGGPTPRILFASAHAAPHLPPRDAPMAHLPEAQFVEEMMVRYGGIPRPVLEDRELLAMFVRVLLSDMRALEAYVYVPGPKLNCAIAAYGGDRDRLDPEVLKRWSELTERGFSFRMFRGDHFFLTSQRDELLFEVSGALRAALAQTPGPSGDPRAGDEQQRPPAPRTGVPISNQRGAT